MILYIDTTKGDDVQITLRQDRGVIISKKFKAKRKQAERLLAGIDKLLKSKKLSLSDIKKIEVVNSGGSFTALRIGVVTANALGYGLGIPVLAPDRKVKRVKSHGREISIVEPKYDSEPVITKKKINKC